MDLTGLQYFIAVADTGSFSRAADLNFVAQPALSRKISALESELGCKLFERNTRRVKLTPAGNLLLCYARDCIHAAEMLLQEARELQQSNQGLNIGYVSGGVKRMITAALPLSQGGKDSIQITLLRQPTNEAIKLLESGELDAALLSLPAVKYNSNLAYALVCPGGICAFVSRAHPLSKRDSLSIEDIYAEPITTFPPEKAGGEYIKLMEAFTARGKKPNIAAFSSDTLSFSVLVEVEQYIGLMLSSSRFIESDLIKCIPIIELESGFDIVFTWKKGRDSAPLRLLYEAILSSGHSKKAEVKS